MFPQNGNAETDLLHGIGSEVKYIFWQKYIGMDETDLIAVYRLYDKKDSMIKRK